MNIFSRYLIKNVFLGFAAAAALLIPLFSTFDFINELDDVSSGGYHWTQALMVVLMKLPRCLIDLGPFIALLGGIIGLGQLSKSLELTAMRVSGMSVFRIGMNALCAGIIFTVALCALDEWVASPLQQRALQLKDIAEARDDNASGSANTLWARKNNEFVTIKTLDEYNRPVGIEIFKYHKDLTLDYYIYAKTATIIGNGIWTLYDVNQKKWADGKETSTLHDSMPWQSIFNHTSLKELMMPSDSFSIRQLNNYIDYLQTTNQPDLEFRIALWQKLGQPVLILAMILLSVPFTFSNPRAPGMGSRLATGAIIGLLTYVSYQIIVNLGLLFSFSAPLTALLPPILLLALALILVNRFDKKH
ncbi:LPS export ABC transporter permease LptG [Pantoea coffeiphila]|uniref:LPS export ABC transporter permease LptG n=1 Tax=Pantoea coffeiphila TaxID=1465635 RepID=A0A2S9ICG7_9GAMM|nr:LPS export ABC transporter permease LptG [Pantoea coffeiphila]PRD15472.1 LPS export ABC transporter permease LptG [Pantoea coffeiphila]